MDWWLLVTLLVLVGLALLAWSLRALDAAGAAAAFLLGLWVAVGAGIDWLILMTLFTVLGVVATAAGRKRKKAAGLEDEVDGERSWTNVVANGAAAALAVLAWISLPDKQAAALAFATAIAAVTADTMASEVGCLAPRVRRIIPPFPFQDPGSNGGVSWRGQIAAAFGATLIAVASIWLLDIPRSLAWVPALAGFLGCQLDSVLGATLEKDALQDRPLSKQDVNFLASVIPAGIVLVAFVL